MHSWHFDLFLANSHSNLLFENVCLTGQILLPTHEVPVLLVAGGVCGKLDSLRAVLILHRAVSRA